MEVTPQLIHSTLKLAILAGDAIMEIYNTPFSIEYKDDSSPLTLADKNAHSVIMNGLSNTGLPVLSEEGKQTDYDIRKHWSQYWLVDPLDGTKEFVNRNGDFTVNIALINNTEPVFGVVYAPVSSVIYWGSESGSYKLEVNKQFRTDLKIIDIQHFAEKLPIHTRREKFIVLGSKSHMNSETENYIQALKISFPDLEFYSRGSSLKFCVLAEGNADVYPRFGPTMEWDTAAGHAVAKFAGFCIDQAENGQPLRYNKPALLNPNFIAMQKK